MNRENIYSFFLAYLENSLSPDERKKFDETLASSDKIQKDYQDFVCTVNTLKSMSDKTAKVPQGFDLSVMQAIEKISPSQARPTQAEEKTRRIDPKTLKIIKILATVVLVTLTITTFILLGGTNILNTTKGAAIIVMLLLLTFMSSKLPQKIRERSFIPLTPALGSTAVILLLMTYVLMPLGISTFQDSSQQRAVLSGETFSDANKALSDLHFSNTFSKSATHDEKKDGASNYKDKKALPEKKSPLTFNSYQEIDTQQSAQSLQKMAVDTTKNDAQVSVIMKEEENLVGAARSDSAAELNTSAPTKIEPIQNNQEEHSASGFKIVAKEPLSTFSIDVDAASYLDVRRFLNRNQKPPQEAVRIEELINYFKYDLATPKTKEVPFAITTELAQAPWAKSHQLLRIGVKGYVGDDKELPANNLVFLIDTSESMLSFDKLPLLKQGLSFLATHLRPQDHISIVTYAGSTGVELSPTSGGDKGKILAAINNLQAEGDTAEGGALDLAYQAARDSFITGGNNRIILATDNDFNVGVSNTSELIKIVEERCKSGISLSVLAFGADNYKDGRIKQLANKGNGAYAYIDNLFEAKKVLVEDITTPLFTIAKDVKIQIEFNPIYAQAYRLLGYEEQLPTDEHFIDNDTGEVKAGHSVTTLYEIIPVGVELGAAERGAESTSQEASSLPSKEALDSASNGGLATIKLHYKLPNEGVSKYIVQTLSSKVVEKPSNDFRLAAAVAEFGMLLQDSPFKGTASFAEASALVKSVNTTTEVEVRTELIRLIEIGQLLN